MLYAVLNLFVSLPTRTCLLSSSNLRSNNDSFDGTGADEDKWNMLLAITVIFLWFDSLQYMLLDSWLLGKDGQTNSVLLLKGSMTKVLRVAVFFAPIYIGYVAFGVSMFGSQVPQFETFGAAAITLFATLNGDENRQAFEAMELDCGDCPLPMVSWLYLSSWLCFAMYVFINIVIAIVEDTWISLQKVETVGVLEDRETLQDHVLGEVLGGSMGQQDGHGFAAENIREKCCGSDEVIRNTELLFTMAVQEVALEMGI